MPAHDFAKYLQKEHYQNLFYRANKHFNEIKHRLYLSSYAIPYPNYSKLDDIQIEKIYFLEKKEGALTLFKIKLRLDIVLCGKRDGDFDEDTIYKYFEVDCSGFFDDGLKQFQIRNVAEFNGGYSNYKEQLSTSLIPYISSNELDMRAEAFLKKYCPEALVKPMKLPIKEVLRKMEINLFHAPLSNRIFGKAFFFPSEEKVYNNDIEVVLEKIPRRSILIDPENYFTRNIGSYKNTVIHECVHFELHTTFFEICRFKSDELKSINCRVSDFPKSYGKDYLEAYDRMEYQATYLAPRILMPSEMTLLKYREIREEFTHSINEESFGDIMSKIISKLADFFDVSRQAAKIRLIDLGIYAAAGVDNFINGKKYPNFTFNKDTLKRNQTYVIDYFDLLRAFIAKPELRELSFEGKIAYLNGMLVVNSSKFVEYSNEGEKKLTQYALNHIDECAFVFEKKPSSSSSYSDHMKSLNFMCRAGDPKDYVPADLVADSSQNREKIELARNAKQDHEDLIEAKELLELMYGSFSSALYQVLKYYGFTKEDGEVNINLVHRYTGIDNHTIKSYLSDPSSPKKEVLISLCSGLRLHPRLSDRLFERAALNIRGSASENDMIYACFLEQHYREGILKWNERFRAIGKLELVMPEPTGTD